MNNIINSLSLDANSALRRLLGIHLSWVHSSRFLVVGEHVVAPYFSIDCGSCFIVFSMDRRETSIDKIDHYVMDIQSSPFVDARGLAEFTLLRDVSTVAIQQFVVERVIVWRTRVQGVHESVTFDSWISLQSAGGKELSLGPALRVFDGVCLKFGSPEQQSSSEQLDERIRFVIE